MSLDYLTDIGNGLYDLVDKINDFAETFRKCDESRFDVQGYLNIIE